ncbi:MAG: carbon-nitrogen hydrolase family protein [Gemmatimonadota bacterium]
MTARIVRAAAVQAAPVMLDLAATLVRLDDWTARAAAKNADLVVFPETWIPGYPAWLDLAPDAARFGHDGAKRLFARLFENSVEVPGPAADTIAGIARTHQVTLVVGVHERAGRSLYNTMLVFGPDGSIRNRHRKLIPTYGERLIWAQGDGDGLRVVETPAGRLGGLICWEHWMPLARQALHDQQEEIHVALWPEIKEMYQVASRHYAFEGRCFVVAAGSIQRRADLPAELPVPPVNGDGPGDLIVAGGSAIIGPAGQYLVGPVYGEETILVADLDLAEIARESLLLDVSGHYSRPDVFKLEVSRGR